MQFRLLGWHLFVFINSLTSWNLDAVGNNLPCQTQEALPPNGEFSAKGNMCYYSDSSGSLPIQSIHKKQSFFLPVPDPIPQFGKNQKPHWLLANVKNDKTSASTFVAEVDYPFLEKIEFYLVDSTGSIVQESSVMSWSAPTKFQDSGYRNPIFRFTIPKGCSYQLFVRAEAGPNRLSIPIRLWTEESFNLHKYLDQSFWACLSGVFFCIIFLGVLLWLLLRKRLYIYYAFYAITSWLYLVSMDGFFLEWIEYSHYGFVTAIDFRYFWTAVQILLELLFVRKFVFGQILRFPLARFAYHTGIVAICTNILFISVNSYFPSIFRLHPALFTPWISFNFVSPIIISLVLVLGVAFLPNYRQGPSGQSARIYLLATAPLLIVTVGSMFRNYNLIPDHLLLRSEGTAMSLLFEFMMLSIGLGFRYKRLENDQRHFAEQAYQQQQLAIQAQLKLRQEEIKTLQAQLKLQKEKERIARDLHDHVGSQLSVIANSLNYPSQEDPASHRIETLGTYAKDAIQSLRDTIWAIHQEEISLTEFRIKLQQHLDRLQPLVQGCILSIKSDIQSSRSLSSIQALNLFRIVQEALNNAIKYSRASQINVTILFSLHQKFQLAIEDNGVGFPPGNLHDDAHYGLINIQHRADEIGGDCEILSIPGEGTLIRITLIPEPDNTLTTV